MRKHQEEKKKSQIEQNKISLGERYDKERLEKMKPPSFLNKESER